jgi:hypothetical protein
MSEAKSGTAHPDFALARSSRLPAQLTRTALREMALDP